MTEQELIGRLEAASGPDRELGAKILLACGWTEWKQDKGLVWLTPPNNKSMYLRGHVSCPDPTSSIDAALQLVPEGWSWSVWNNRYLLAPEAPDTFGAAVEARFAKMWTDRKTRPAIALCIAALKARARQRTQADAPARSNPLSPSSPSTRVE